MSNRRYGKARRKRWNCGHRGWGEQCHRCALADKIEYGPLPKAYCKRDYNGDPEWTVDELLAEAARLRAGDTQPVLEGAYRRSAAVIASVFVLLFVVLGTGCTTAGGHTRVDWPKVAHCAPSTSDVVASVSRVLLGDGPSTQSTISERAVSELEDLARANTPTLIACLVNELVSGWSRPGAAQHPDRVAATQRGRDFLERVAQTTVAP